MSSSESTALSLQYSKDERVASSLEELLHAVGRTTFAMQIIDKLVLDASVNSSRRASNAWIALHILQGSQSSEEQTDELYSLATDWLIQSDSSYSATDIPTPTLMISLDILAFTASTRAFAFRENLIDILYPTLSLLSHASPQIQSSARQYTRANRYFNRLQRYSNSNSREHRLSSQQCCVETQRV